MDTTTFRIVFALVFVTVTVAETANDAQVPRTRRSSFFGQPFAMPRKRSSYVEGTEEKRKASFFGQPFAMPRKRSSYVEDTEEKRKASYLAFPRLGRGYLALPRMGRSQPGNDASAANGASCCTTGLKKEWLFGEDGKMTAQNVCEAESCCPDFLEVENTKPDGTFYTMCIPRTLDAPSDMMLNLKRLLRN